MFDESELKYAENEIAIKQIFFPGLIGIVPVEKITINVHSLKLIWHFFLQLYSVL